MGRQVGEVGSAGVVGGYVGVARLREGVGVGGGGVAGAVGGR